MGEGSGALGPEALPGVGDGPDRANVARMYDYLLGGKDNVAADRLLAARVAEVQPLVVAGVRSNRAFVRRAVAYLAGQGISQFVDLGSGLPTGQSVHDVAGRIDPDARTVYVDHDPSNSGCVHARIARQPRSHKVGVMRELPVNCMRNVQSIAQGEPGPRLLVRSSAGAPRPGRLSQWLCPMSVRHGHRGMARGVVAAEPSRSWVRREGPARREVASRSYRRRPSPAALGV